MTAEPTPTPDLPTELRDIADFYSSEIGRGSDYLREAADEIDRWRATPTPDEDMPIWSTNDITRMLADLETKLEAVTSLHRRWTRLADWTDAPPSASLDEVFDVWRDMGALLTATPTPDPTPITIATLDDVRQLAETILSRAWHPGHLDAAGHTLNALAAEVDRLRADLATAEQRANNAEQERPAAGDMLKPEHHQFVRDGVARLRAAEQAIERVKALHRKWSRGPQRGDMVPADELAAALGGKQNATSPTPLEQAKAVQPGDSPFDAHRKIETAVRAALDAALGASFTSPDGQVDETK